MDETETVETSGERTRVGFPETKEEKPKSKKGLIITLILLLLLLGFGGWYLFGRSQTPIVSETTPTPTEIVETSTPTPTPAAVEAEREGVTIQVLNGTGISGAAGDLQKALETLGYSDIKVGNASPQTAVKTTVAFDSSLDEAVKAEILKLLQEKYQEVTQSEKANASFDAVITTGYPKGHKATVAPTTARVSATPTSRPTTGTVTTTPTGSISVSPSPTP